MGYDISLECVREIEGRPGFYCGIAEAPDFFYPARYVREMITALDAELLSQLDLRSEWLIDNPPPDSMLEDGECEIEGHITDDYFCEPETLLKNIRILRSLSQDQTKSLDFLFDLSNAYIEVQNFGKIMNEFWAIVDSEQRFFASAWNRCESYAIYDSPIQWYSKERPKEESAIQDLRRAEHLSLYLFGVNIPGFVGRFGVRSTLEEQKSEAYERWSSQEPSDVVEIIKRTYQQKFGHLFNEIEKVCNYALENSVKIFVFHSH